MTLFLRKMSRRRIFISLPISVLSDLVDHGTSIRMGRTMRVEVQFISLDVLPWSPSISHPHLEVVRWEEVEVAFSRMRG